MVSARDNVALQIAGFVSNLVLGKLLHDSGHSHADLPSLDQDAHSKKEGRRTRRVICGPRALPAIAAAARLERGGACESATDRRSSRQALYFAGSGCGHSHGGGHGHSHGEAGAGRVNLQAAFIHTMGGDLRPAPPTPSPSSTRTHAHCRNHLHYRASLHRRALWLLWRCEMRIAVLRCVLPAAHTSARRQPRQRSAQGVCARARACACACVRVRVCVGVGVRA